MSLLHVKSDTIGNWTGTVTVLNSQGSTATVAATDLVQPGDWNSAHNWSQKISGNTSGSSTATGTDYVFGGTGGVTLSHSTAASAATLWISAPNQVTGSWWQPELYGTTVNTTLANGTLYLRPFELDNYQDANKIGFFHSRVSSATTASFSGSVSSQSGSSGTGSWGHTATQLFFTRANTNVTATDFNRIITLASNTWSNSAGYSASVSWSTAGSSATVSLTTSAAVGFIANIDSNGNITTTSSSSSNSTSFSSTSTNQNSFSSSFVLSFPYAYFSGQRAQWIGNSALGTTVMQPAEYWMGVIHSTTTGSTNMDLRRVAYQSDGGLLFMSISTNSYMEIGSSAALSTSGIRPIFGSYSSSGNTTTTIALSQCTAMSNHASMWFALCAATE